MEEREMYDEITALVGAVGKALSMSEIEVITAIEQGRLTMELEADENGLNYLDCACDDRTARVYKDAIYRPGDSSDVRPDPDSLWPDPEDAARSDSGGCGGGCSCGSRGE